MDSEIRDLDMALSAKLGAGDIQSAIRDVIKVTISEGVQRTQVDINGIAEGVSNKFKQELKSGFTHFTDDWVDQNGIFEVVPHGTKLFKTVGNYKMLVVEQSPAVRTLTFANDRQSGGGNGAFSLALPYVVFICTVSPNDNLGYLANFTVSYARKPLTSIKSLVYPTNLPNTRADVIGGVCMGTGWNEVTSQWQREKRTFTMSEAVEAAIGYFWNSVFNNDMPEAWNQAIAVDNRISSLSNWALNTSRNPLFMLDIPWPRGRHVKDAVASMITSDDMRLQFAPIIDRAVRHAGEELTRYFNKMQTNGVFVPEPSNRALGQLRTKLYDFLFKTCSGLIDSVASKREKEIRQKLEKEFELRRPTPKQENKLQKYARYESGDYMYRAPDYEIW